jgi:hypothetical protein
VGDGFALIAHVGYQKLKGSAKLTETDGNVANDYWDWKLGGSYTFSTGYVVSLVYIDTNVDVRPYSSSRIVSGATGVLSVSRTF